jgi:hypothetical protein
MKSLVDKILLEFEYGKVLFGQESDLAELQGEPQEKNTREETGVYNTLKNYIGDEQSVSKQKVGTELEKIKNLKTVAPKLLKPDFKTYYRGTYINASTLLKYFKTYKIFLSSFDKFKKGSFDGYISNDTFTYKPRSSFTSWSGDIWVAQEFGYSGSNDDYQVIYETPVDNSFVLSSKFTNKLSKETLGGLEYESISTNSEFNKVKMVFEKHEFAKIRRIFN